MKRKVGRHLLTVALMVASLVQVTYAAQQRTVAELRAHRCCADNCPRREPIDPIRCCALNAAEDGTTVAPARLTPEVHGSDWVMAELIVPSAVPSPAIAIAVTDPIGGRAGPVFLRTLHLQI